MTWLRATALTEETAKTAAMKEVEKCMLKKQRFVLMIVCNLDVEGLESKASSVLGGWAMNGLLDVLIVSDE